MESNIIDVLRKVIPSNFTETGFSVSSRHEEEKTPGEPEYKTARLFAKGTWEGQVADAVAIASFKDEDHDEPTLNIYYDGKVLVRENGKEITCEVPF